jgi:hypothetical protein
MAIEVRGTPNENDPVHFARPRLPWRNINTYCGNGSWHIKHSDDMSEVTCEECLKRKRE